MISEKGGTGWNILNGYVDAGRRSGNTGREQSGLIHLRSRKNKKMIWKWVIQ